MKRKLAGFLCVMVCSLFVGCGGGGAGGNSPGGVVKTYMKAVIEGDTKKALTCIDPAKRQQAGQLLEMATAIASGFAQVEGGLDSVTILSEDVQGDRAQVGYQTKTKKGVERRDSLRTEKINGTWYVAP